MPGDSVFEGVGELIEFFCANKAALREELVALAAAERPRSAAALRSCGYTAVRDFVFKCGHAATDCQLYRMADILICEGSGTIWQERI